MRSLVAQVPRGWRKIATEIAIVFVGVLIALYAQQIVDNWEWRDKVRTAEAAMRRELFFDNGPQIYGRAVVHPCLQSRLNAVRAAVQSGKSREEIADLIAGVQVDFSRVTTAWRSSPPSRPTSPPTCPRTGWMLTSRPTR